ncbi:sensor histidine kinase [Pseudonocardia acaciae]|uniref:sensor histidine kinase n=1 Tax=Pseudonocardia acaciae TaxID=551276 RepID=UPI0007E8BFDD|nr:sensor histidine kinase [Pseudonocardia acaciae]
MEHSNPARWWAGLRTSRRELIFDAVMVLLVEAFLVMVLWELLVQHGPWGLVIQAVLAATLLFRRSAPLTVLTLMLLSTIALIPVGQWWPNLMLSMIGDINQGWLVLAVPFAAYAALVYSSDRRRAWIMSGAIMVVATRPWDPAVFERTVGVVIVVGLPALLGNYVASLNERVERAEREQHRLAEQARVEERVRLAAEMHDVVTHRVSLMVLQAGALGVTATDAETRAAAEDLRAAGCQALEELRDLVGVLRAAPEDAVEDVAVARAGGQAGAPDFAELLTESESIGVSVELDQRGNPAIASPVVGRTAYRIVQEALTNVRKHAPGATAKVTMDYQSDRVRLTVRNSAPERQVDESLTASGSGTGLLGLRQRVELVSGTLHAGPTEDGGFEVDATLPSYVPTREEPARSGARAHRVRNGPANGAPAWAHPARRDA